MTANFRISFPFQRVVSASIKLHSGKLLFFSNHEANIMINSVKNRCAHYIGITSVLLFLVKFISSRYTCRCIDLESNLRQSALARHSRVWYDSKAISGNYTRELYTYAIRLCVPLGELVVLYTMETARKNSHLIAIRIAFSQSAAINSALHFT